MNINIQSYFIRYGAFICACIFLVVSLFAIPAFAYTDTSTNGIDFTDYPMDVEINTLEGRDLNSIIFGSTTRGNGNLYLSFSGTWAADYYLFTYTDPNHNNKNKLVFCGISNTAANVVVYPGIYSVYGTTSRGNSITIGTDTYEYQEISCPVQGDSWYNYTLIDMPHFATLQNGLDALTDWIANPPPPLNPDAPIAITLKPGYVGYFDITDLNVEVTLGTSLFSGAKYPGFSTNQAIGLASTLPSGSFSLPITGTSPINWRGSSQQNLIGQYSSFSYKFPYSGTGSHHYICIVNPLSGPAPVLSALGASASNRNGNITVLIDHCRGSKIYSLTESLDIGSGSLDTGSDGDSVNDGVYNPNDGSWEFSNPSTGLSERPDQLPTGGGNDPLIGGNSGNTINDFLQDIADTIKGFFTGAIGAVQTLVGAGSSFFHALIGLYSWLPSPVLSVLTSALVLVITIGVIKVFI